MLPVIVAVLAAHLYLVAVSATGPILSRGAIYFERLATKRPIEALDGCQ